MKEALFSDIVPVRSLVWQKRSSQNADHACRLQTADRRLRTVQTMQTVQTEYFFFLFLFLHLLLTCIFLVLATK